MKRLLVCVLVLFVSVAISACTEEASQTAESEAAELATATQDADPCVDQRGAWQTEIGNQKGMWIAGEAHFVLLMIDKDRGTFAGETPTEAEKATAFSSMTVGVYENSCEGTENHWKVLYHSNPNAVGATGISDFELDGDVIRWWVLDENGNRPDGPPNTGHRMKSDHGGHCAPLAGTWAFTAEGKEGLWVVTESYGIELRVEEGRDSFEDQPATQAERARAYDTVTWAGAWSQTCDGPGRGAYENLYAFNPALQGERLHFDYVIEGGSQTWWNYPEGGERADEPSGVGHRIN